MIISKKKDVIGQGIEYFLTKEEYREHSFLYFNITIDPGNDPGDAFIRIKDFLEKNECTILFGLGFGFNKPGPGRDLKKILPVMLFYYGQQKSPGLQLICTDDKEVVSENTENNIYCNSVEHNNRRLHYFYDIIPAKKNECYDQAYRSFSMLGKLLKRKNISYNSLARTWLYLDNILSWYDELNRARTDFYEREDIFSILIPASTGIGVSNEHGRCISLSALAVTGEDACQYVSPVDSPMQCSAVDYKSSFSRAVEIDLKGSKRLIISGTASIDEQGDTLYPVSAGKQVDHTMKVVNAILDHNDYSWDNVVRAIVYFPDLSNRRYFDDYCKKNNLDRSAVLLVSGVVCRDNLLFEIELDAVKSV